MNDVLIAIGGCAVGWLVTWGTIGGRAKRYRRAFRVLYETCIDNQNRIASALDQVTPGANATVKRMARMLRGEQ